MGWAGRMYVYGFSDLPRHIGNGEWIATAGTFAGRMLTEYEFRRAAAANLLLAAAASAYNNGRPVLLVPLPGLTIRDMFGYGSVHVHPVEIVRARNGTARLSDTWYSLLPRQVAEKLLDGMPALLVVPEAEPVPVKEAPGELAMPAEGLLKDVKTWKLNSITIIPVTLSVRGDKIVASPTETGAKVTLNSTYIARARYINNKRMGVSQKPYNPIDSAVVELIPPRGDNTVLAAYVDYNDLYTAVVKDLSEKFKQGLISNDFFDIPPSIKIHVVGDRFRNPFLIEVTQQQGPFIILGRALSGAESGHAYDASLKSNSNQVDRIVPIGQLYHYVTPLGNTVLAYRDRPDKPMPLVIVVERDGSKYRVAGFWLSPEAAMYVEPVVFDASTAYAVEQAPPVTIRLEKTVEAKPLNIYNTAVRNLLLESRQPAGQHQLYEIVSITVPAGAETQVEQILLEALENGEAEIRGDHLIVTERTLHKLRNVAVVNTAPVIEKRVA